MGHQSLSIVFIIENAIIVHDIVLLSGKRLLRFQEALVSQSMHYHYYGRKLVEITKGHTSCNTDPSVDISLLNMKYLMVKVWGTLEQTTFLCAGEGDGIRSINRHIVNKPLG